ncbi:MAG: U4/U6-U5 snRNP complex subunit lsm3 [Paramarteilia canceri]
MEQVELQLRDQRKLVGMLHAFDSHLNMVIGAAEETNYEKIFDSETNEAAFKKTVRKLPLVFLRGDSIISISKYQAS